MPDPALRQAHVATAAQMLQVEAASKRLLTLTVEGAAARARSPEEAASTVRRTIPQVVVATRTTARRAGSQAMSREFAAIRRSPLGANVPPLFFGAEDVTQEDHDAAREIANNYADDVLARAGKEKSTAARIIAALTFRIDAIAATETAQQFNRQRARNEQNLRGQYLGTAWLPLLVKQWDATLDRRVCRVCAARHGKLRPIGLDWDGQSPGMTHVGCRCQSHYFASVLFAGREFAA